MMDPFSRPLLLSTSTSKISSKCASIESYTGQSKACHSHEPGALFSVVIALCATPVQHNRV
jgi:hypothetical protein